MTKSESSELKPTWKFNVLFIGVMTTAIGLLMMLLLQYNDGRSPLMHLLDNMVLAFVYTVVLTYSFRSAGHALRKRYPLNSKKSLLIYIAVSSVVMVVAFLLATWINGLIYSTYTITHVGSTAFNIAFVMSMIASIIGNGIHFGYEFYYRMLQAERKHYESQLAALKAQINPHFLFNSLNSIASLIRINPEKAEGVTHDLADLFRYSLRSSKKHEVTLKEELNAVKTYMAIEKARFGDRLTCSFHVDEEAEIVNIPGFTLQPLFENSIKHGCSKTMDPFEIQLDAKIKNDYLLLTVTDSGPGFGEQATSKILSKGTGISNINERLKLHYGENAELIPHGQSVALTIPLN